MGEKNSVNTYRFRPEVMPGNTDTQPELGAVILPYPNGGFKFTRPGTIARSIQKGVLVMSKLTRAILRPIQHQRNGHGC